MKTYQTPFGIVPSVTAILSETTDPEAKEKLRKWQHKQDQIHGEGKANQIGEEAKARGTKLHALIEAYINRNVQMFIEPDEPFEYWHPQLKALLNSIDHTDVISFEKFMFCKSYGGTVDLIANINEQTTIVDWKTSKRTKRREWMEEAFIQCAAYAQLTEINTTHNIKQLMVCVISPNRLQIFTEENIDKYTELWEERLEQFYKIYDPQANHF